MSARVTRPARWSHGQEHAHPLISPVGPCPRCWPPRCSPWAGLALWADSRKDADGYLATDAYRFAAASATSALATADLDFDGLDGALTAGDDAGRVRFTADQRTASRCSWASPARAT